MDDAISIIRRMDGSPIEIKDAVLSLVREERGKLAVRVFEEDLDKLRAILSSSIELDESEEPSLIVHVFNLFIALEHELSKAGVDGRGLRAALLALKQGDHRAGPDSRAAIHGQIVKPLMKLSDYLRTDLADAVEQAGTEELEQAEDLEFIRSLGEGASAHVWLVREKSLDREVAVRLEWREENAIINRAKILAKAKHPNIVTVHYIKWVKRPENGHQALGIFLEFLEGDTLEKVVKDRLLSLDRTKWIASSLLDGIEHLHANGLTHGDIHEGNVFVTSHAVKLIDITNVKTETDPPTMGWPQLVDRDIAQLKAVLIRLLMKSEFGLVSSAMTEKKLKEASSIVEIREICTVLAEGESPQLGNALNAVPGTTGKSKVDLEKVPFISIKRTLTEGYQDCSFEMKISGPPARNVVVGYDQEGQRHEVTKTMLLEEGEQNLGFKIQFLGKPESVEKVRKAPVPPRQFSWSTTIRKVAVPAVIVVTRIAELRLY